MRVKAASYPYIAWALLFIAIPLGLIVYFSFTGTDGGFTFDNIIKSGSYGNVLIKSIWLSVVSTVICLLIGYPIAYMMSRTSAFTARTILLLLMLPMWMNFLLRTYGWMTILENNGVINQLFGLIGLGPFQMINTQGAVVLGMVYNYIAFMILPLNSVMSKIGKDVIEAAQDLGASPSRVFSDVILPLSIPGIKVGVILVFVPAVSTFIISQMLGGGGNQLIGDIIELQFFGNAYNPNLGSAISMVLMLMVLLVMSVSGFLNDDEWGEKLI